MGKDGRKYRVKPTFSPFLESEQAKFSNSRLANSSLTACNGNNIFYLLRILFCGV